MGPFERHLREAIALNLSRRDRYAELSGGASLPISRALVRNERMLLPVARWFDRRAAPYHQAGVPLLEEIFVDMDRVPPFSRDGRPRPALEAEHPQGSRIRSRVLRTFGRGGFAAAEVVLAEEIEALAHAPYYHCLLRHLLESAHRVCVMAPLLGDMAAVRGLASPDRLLERLLRLHAWGLGSAARLDRRAYPIQRRGIPILARDVPPIPRVLHPRATGTGVAPVSRSRGALQAADTPSS